MLTESAEDRLTQPDAFTALREIARSLSAAWDLDTTLDLIARKTTEVMGVHSCTIYLLDPDGALLRLRATTGLARRSLGRATLAVGEGMTGRAVVKNRPVYAADAQHDPHFKWVDDTREGRFRSLLAVPLVLDGEPIGALNVQTRDPHDYPQAEIDILTLIADLAAGALAKAELYDRQRRQLDELQTLARVSEAVTSPQYLDDILDVVTEMAARTMAADTCAIYLQDNATGALVRRASNSAAASEAASDGALRASLEQVVATGKTVYQPSDAQVTAEASQGAFLAVPLAVGDRVIGVLVCATSTSSSFPEQQQSLLNTLANQTALAIENARLVTNAAVVREMHHRIKNNLQTVAMLMQLQLPDADRLDARDVLTTNIHRIQTIAAVHDILSEQGFRLVDVRAVVQRIVQTMTTAMSRPNQQIAIAVHGEALQLPSRAATALCVVINELVQNSLEHGFAGRDRGRIDISLSRRPDGPLILVQDDGVGLPEEVEPSLGLDIARELITGDLQGEIQFNRRSPGTEVVITLPRVIELLEGRED